MVEMLAEALRMTAQAFRRGICHSEALEGALRRYVQAQVRKVSQRTACNSRHWV